MRTRLALGLLAALALAPATHAQSNTAVAPERYAHVVPRIGGDTGFVYSNLRYEGNNRSFRGAFDPQPASGCDLARRYRRQVARVRGVFVLRDALFSQQDHPVEHRACALMMPANWITAAVADTSAGVPLRGVRAPAPAEDAPWAAIASAAAMFGSFPPSERLFETARRARAGASPEERAQIENARFNVRALAAEAQHLIDAAPRGAQAVADAGAERIAASDRAYFTPELRRDRVIVLGVEHPNEHELRDENKGVAIWGRDVAPAVLRTVRDAIYRRRLADGDLAIERYDLTRASDRRRAIDVLRAIVPRGAAGEHRVWLWVGGPLIEGTEVVRDASHLLPALQRELARAPIAHDRVVVFNRPSFRIRGRTAEDLEREVDRFAALRLPLSLNMSPDAVRNAIGRR